MFIHAVRLESDHSEILASFSGTGFRSLNKWERPRQASPKVWKVNLLTERIVVPSLQFGEIDTRIVYSRPRNARNHPNEFPVLN
jgi:hypothetical protein